MSRFPKIPKFGQKVLNLGIFFGIFDEILPKFIPLIFQSSLEEKVQTLTISTVSTVLSSMNLAGRRLLMFQRSWHQFRKNFFEFSFCPSFHDQRMVFEKKYELTRKNFSSIRLCNESMVHVCIFRHVTLAPSIAFWALCPPVYGSYHF